MRRILLLCGVLSPLVYAAADTLAGLQSDTYSFRDQTISELGAIGAPSRPLFGALLIPAFLLLAAFGVAVRQAAKGKRGIRIAGDLLIGLGIMALTVGQFVPMHARGTAQGVTGALHLVEAGMGMLLVLAAMGYTATALGGRFRLYTIMTVAIVVLFGAWSGMEAPRIEAGLATPWVGVKERIFWYACQWWFVVLAVTLFRQPTTGTEHRA